MSHMARKLRNYEAMVILDAGLNDQETNALIERLQKVLTDGGANLKEVSRWGRRRLAYPIRKKNDAYYVIFYFTLEGSGQVLEQFERACRFDENVYRHMVVQVPLKKRGLEVAQIVPSPGYLADFRVEPRAKAMARRRASSQYDEAGEGGGAATAVEERPAPEQPSEAERPADDAASSQE